MIYFLYIPIWVEQIHQNYTWYSPPLSLSFSLKCFNFRQGNLIASVSYGYSIISLFSFSFTLMKRFRSKTSEDSILVFFFLSRNISFNYHIPNSLNSKLYYDLANFMCMKHITKYQLNCTSHSYKITKKNDQIIRCKGLLVIYMQVLTYYFFSFHYKLRSTSS